MAKINFSYPKNGDTIQAPTSETYTIGNIVNQGNFGILYEGFDTFDNQVAIKVLKPANKPFAVVQKAWENEIEILHKVRQIGRAHV